MASPIPPGKLQFIDGAGNPLAGGTVATYIPGTTTPKTTYQDFAGTIANANPITLDANGEAVILGTGEYLMTVNDSLGNLIWSQVTGVAQNTDLTDGSTSAAPLVVSYLTVTNTIKAAAANITGAASIGGNATLGGTLAVTGTTALTGALTASAAAFSGTTTAPTPGSSDNSTNVATTAFVNTALAGITLATNLYGLITSYVSSTSYAVASGGALSDDFSTFLPFPTGFTKTLASFAAGTNAGSLDTGAVANSTWYTIWLIYNPTARVSDILASANATSPTLPSGYTKKVRIWAIYNNSSGSIANYTQNLNECLYATGFADTANTISASSALVSLTVPKGIKVNALFNANLYSNYAGSDAAIIFQSPDQSAITPSATGNSSLAVAPSYSGTVPTSSCAFNLRTDTSGRINVTGSISSASIGYSIVTNGFVYPRGLT